MSVDQHSLMSLYVELFFNNTLLAKATAFLIRKNERLFLITNRHNVTGRDQHTNRTMCEHGGVPNTIRVRRVSGHPDWTSEDYQLLDNEDNPLWHEHPTLGARADFVALELKDHNHLQQYDYAYNLSDPVKELFLTPSDTLSVIGFPFGHTAGGYFPIWVSGFLASEMDNDYNDLPQFLIDCRTRTGQSGSPVIAFRNGFARYKDGSSVMSGQPVAQFLGIYCGRINKESDIGIVWKRQAIKELIDSVL